MSKKAKKKIAKRHLKSVKTKTKATTRPKKAKPAPASTTTRDRCIDMLTFSRTTLVKFMTGFPADKSTAQPNGLANHLLWTQGHLAATAGWALSLINGDKTGVPAAYEKMFGMGSKPVDDASQYPPAADVRKAFEDVHEKLLAATKKLNDAALAAPVEAGGFAKDKADLLLKISWHEGWHLGQVADLRRALGLPAAFGA